MYKQSENNTFLVTFSKNDVRTTYLIFKVFIHLVLAKRVAFY